ncbi:MAG: protein kinase, partial [Atopobiaceae bacterium]|nr:protein kinase [Atopobiaceae bacterium]
MADTQIGGTIGGRYNVIDKLGEGGMSVVWLVRDSRLEKLWAIKEIKKNASDATHRVDVDLMRKEANIMKNLDHPNIVHVVDIIEESGALYVVMDYVPGKDLAKTMRENRAALGTGVYAYPQVDVIDWGIQLCDALGYLHS